jgi:hypothetical protein
MTGDRLAKAAQRLVGEELFTFVVSPAIADLQFDANHQPLRARAFAYVAVWRALLGAVALEVTGRARLVRQDAALLAGLTFLQTAYYLCMLAVALEHVSVPRTLLVGVAVSAFSAASTLIGFWPAESAPLRTDVGTATR